jgi:hypothetical protein
MSAIGRVSGTDAAVAALRRLDQPVDPISSPGALNQQMVAQEAAIRVLKVTNDMSVSVLQLLETGHQVDYRV